MKCKQKQNKPNYNSNNITSLKKGGKKELTHMTFRHRILTVNSQAKDEKRNLRKYQTLVSWFVFFIQWYYLFFPKVLYVCFKIEHISKYLVENGSHDIHCQRKELQMWKGRWLE